MGTPLPQPPAHKGLRGQILLELKRAQPLTATELADKLGVSPNAVRHHLKELEAEQLIVYGREQRGVGAPTSLPSPYSPRNVRPTWVRACRILLISFVRTSPGRCTRADARRPVPTLVGQLVR